MEETTDSTSGQASEAPKRKGNPNFQKGKKNTYFDKNTGQEVYSNNIQNKMEENNTSNSQSASGNGGNGNGGNGGNSIPKDIFSDEMPSSESMPLDGPVKEKAYAALKDTSTASNNGGGNGTPPPVDGSPAPISVSSGSAPVVAPGEKTPEERRTEAEQAVKLGLRGYEKLHDFGRYLTKKDEKKLAGEHAAGKLNLNMELPLGKGGQTISLGNFIQTYNANIEENVVVSEKFKSEITPPLERIAIKRGWGLSDEMTVAALLFEDVGTKVGLLVGLLKSANMILDLSYNQMANAKKAAAPPPPQNNPEPETVSHSANPDDWHREAQ